MREPTIARNYAQALFEAGERSGETERFAAMLEAVAGAIQADERIRVALDSPRVPKALKQRVLHQALSGRAPETFIRFLGAAVGKEVIPHVRDDPKILGGIVVRIGDRVMDGSVRRKMMQLRKQMLGA